MTDQPQAIAAETTHPSEEELLTARQKGFRDAGAGRDLPPQMFGPALVKAWRKGLADGRRFERDYWRVYEQEVVLNLLANTEYYTEKVKAYKSEQGAIRC